LLYKELTRGRYADFIADLALIDGTPSKPLQPFTMSGREDEIGYACPSIRDVAASLQQNARDPKALNCLGEFVRRNPPEYDFVGTTIVFTSLQQSAGGSRNTAPATLGSGPSQFPGQAFTRIATYQAVFGDAQASADDRAYALYRAIRCFAPSGYSDCGGNEIPKETRKRWFNTLKSAYPHSKAAQSLKYYW
jgi:hypothetical protein